MTSFLCAPPSSAGQRLSLPRRKRLISGRELPECGKEVNRDGMEGAEKLISQLSPAPPETRRWEGGSAEKRMSHLSSAPPETRKVYGHGHNHSHGHFPRQVPRLNLKVPNPEKQNASLSPCPTSATRHPPRKCYHSLVLAFGSQCALLRPCRSLSLCTFSWQARYGLRVVQSGNSSLETECHSFME